MPRGWQLQPSHFNYGALAPESRKNSADQKAARNMMDEQFRKSPGQVTVGTEVSADAASIFAEPSAPGNPNAEKKDNGGYHAEDRAASENHVIRGTEPESVLIAARKSKCTSLEHLHEEILRHGPLGSALKQVTTMLFGKVTWNGHVGNIGKHTAF